MLVALMVSFRTVLALVAETVSVEATDWTVDTQKSASGVKQDIILVNFIQAIQVLLFKFCCYKYICIKPSNCMNYLTNKILWICFT